MPTMAYSRRSYGWRTFAGVNAHHQNGIAERRTRELEELARSTLIHATSCWQHSVMANLWPFAIRHACNAAINHTPSFQDPGQRAPIELFEATKVSRNPKHWKLFGLPVYVLDNNLPARTGTVSQMETLCQSRGGVYIGKLPQHSRNMALVLDRSTALVSPQFHVLTFDTPFDSVKGITVPSMWQTKAGFVAQRELSSKEKEKTSTRASVHGGTAGKKSSTPAASSKKRKRTDGQSQAQATGKNISAAASIGDDGLSVTQMDGELTEVDRHMVETTTRSCQTAKPALRLIEAMATEISKATINDVKGELFTYVTTFPDDDMIDYDDPLQAFKAVSDPDRTIYLRGYVPRRRYDRLRRPSSSF